MENLAFFGGRRIVDSTGAQLHNPWAYTDLEDALKRHLGARYVLLVNSGTSAITAALQAAGVGPGDEVVTVGSLLDRSRCRHLQLQCDTRFRRCRPADLQH